MSVFGQFERVAVGALLAVPISFAFGFVGMLIGIAVHEALFGLDVVTYDAAIRDSEGMWRMHAWFPFAAVGTLLGLLAAIAAGQAIVHRRSKRARKGQV